MPGSGLSTLYVLSHLNLTTLTEVLTLHAPPNITDEETEAQREAMYLVPYHKAVVTVLPKGLTRLLLSTQPQNTLKTKSVLTTQLSLTLQHYAEHQAFRIKGHSCSLGPQGQILIPQAELPSPKLQEDFILHFFFPVCHCFFYFYFVLIFLLVGG